MSRQLINEYRGDLDRLRTISGTIAAKFNTYRFADYKESMITLLAKVVRVSMDTVTITEAMRKLPRGDQQEGPANAA